MPDDLESFKDFQFIDPGFLMDGELVLRLCETRPCNPIKGYVPEYIFEMVHDQVKTVMGELRLRVGLTEKLREFGGHVGYEVAEPYRGHRYAARSFRLILPLIRRFGISPVVITCSPENLPSVRTIESVGAKLVATKNVETAPGTYRITNIYHLMF